MLFIAALLFSTSTFIGTWTGRSECTGVRKACNDESVVYHIVKKSEDTVSVSASKLVDGREVLMGEFNFHIAGDTMTGDYDSGSVKSRWSFTRKDDAMTGTAVLLPGGEVIRNVSLRKTPDPCDAGIPESVDGPIVIRGTILEATSNEHRPLVGADEIRRLWVPMRVDEIVKGSFLIAQGAVFRMAVHSIALSFGGDPVGEQFDVAMKKVGSGYAILGFTPSAASRMQVRGKLMKVTPGAAPGALVASEKPDTTLHLETASGNVAIALELPKTSSAKVGEEVCLFLIRRSGGQRTPWRILRIVM